MKLILVPTDGSPAANDALEKALELAKKFKSKLIAINVIEPVSWTIATTDALLLEARAQEWQKATLESALQRARRKGVRIKTVALRGNIAEEIVSYAKKARCDLIVMGSRGLSATDRFLLGSVSDRVLHHAPCSVLIVRK
ncbi:MAG: universal stress protein [Candidatus Micrarchaeia archaeon]